MTCRIRDGGSPACRLGFQCTEPLGIEVRGKSLSSIHTSRVEGYSVVEGDELTREYDLCIVMESPDKYDSQSGSIGNGSSFQKLLDLVRQTPFSPSRTFVTYLVKCQPPKRPARQSKYY